MSKRWTTEELNILNEHGSTMLTRELVLLLPNRTSYSIRAKIKELHIFMTDDTKQRMNNSRVSNRLIYGVGINDLVDDPDYVTWTKDSSSHVIWRCPFYTKWSSMLYRCYGRKYPSSYTGCTVTEEWHYFSNFKKWMESRSWEGKQLDKDILVPGNKVYGENFCLLVTRDLNTLLNTNEHIRGKYPLGVSSKTVSPQKRVYHARQSKYGKDCHIGHFDTVEEAAFEYNEHRRAYILEVVNGLTLDDTSDVEATRAALLRHMELETDAYRTSSIHV